jgi:hypothetical protein
MTDTLNIECTIAGEQYKVYGFVMNGRVDFFYSVHRINTGWAHLNKRVHHHKITRIRAKLATKINAFIDANQPKGN